MKKKLTYRQQQFLSKFLDIYRDLGHPVHYITVAENLGVGKVTAYEMLRLLEEQGLVQAEYHPNPDQHGPGRSVVLFYPTQEGDQVIKQLEGISLQNEDWETEKELILKELRDEKAGGYEKLISNLLSHIPNCRSPLIFATELITTVVLTLVSIKDLPGIQAILDRLSRIGLPHEIGLGVMSGISMFLSAMDKTSRAAGVLMSHITHYEEVFVQLSEDSKKKLSDYTREVIRILTA